MFKSTTVAVRVLDDNIAATAAVMEKLTALVDEATVVLDRRKVDIPVEVDRRKEKGV